MKISGRVLELATVEAAINRAPGSVPSLVLHGDLGIGKSALLQAGVAYAQQRGNRVLSATGYEDESQLAFAGLHQLFAPVMPYLDRTEPFHQEVLRRVLRYEPGPRPERFAVSAASLALVQAVAADGPVLIAVEDAHWMDQETREVLLFIMLRLRPEGAVSAILAQPLLTAAERRTRGLTTLELGPLSDADSEGLLLDRCPDLPAGLRQRVLLEAAGNPLALTELPAVLAGAAGAPDLVPGRLPLRTRLETDYAAVVRALPDVTRLALLGIALDAEGRDRDTPQVGPAPHPPKLSHQELLDLEQLRLITDGSTPTAPRFRHPLVRSAIIGTALPDEVRAAHGELAAAYHGRPERRMWHLMASATEPDEEVAAEIERAAEQLGGRGGAARAVAALRRAADLSPATNDAVRRLQSAAGLAVDGGQAESAAALLARARIALGSHRPGARDQITRAALAFRFDGDLPGVRKTLFRLLNNGETFPERSDALWLLIMAVHYGQSPEDWSEVTRLVALHGDALDDDVRLLYRSIAGATDLAAGPGAVPEHLANTANLLPEDLTARRLVALSLAASRTDSLSEVRPFLRMLTDRESESGTVVYAVNGYLFSAQDRYLSGDWEAAESAIGHGLDLSIEHGLTVAAHDFRCLLGLIAAGQGDPETVRELSQAIEQWATPRGSGLHLAYSARNLALAALSQGDYETAYAQSARIGISTIGPAFTGIASWTLFDRVEAAVRTGRRDEATELIAVASTAGLADISPRLRMHMLAARALTAPDDEAVPLFHATLALRDVDRWPFETARVGLALGELHRRRHRPGDARPELRRAAGVFARIGATPWQQRAEQELRLAGVTIQTPFTSPHELLPPIELTAQQLEVARLAARDLSNKAIAERLFLSPRTVSAHLYRIFPKLGITSRSALRDALDVLTPAA